MVIDINKKYRYWGGLKATILTVNRPQAKFAPIISMDESGCLHYHKPDGITAPYDPAYTLVEVGPFDHINEGDLVEVNVGSITTIRVFCGVNSRGHAMLRSWGIGKIRHTAKDCRLLVRKEHIIFLPLKRLKV